MLKSYTPLLRYGKLAEEGEVEVKNLENSGHFLWTVPYMFLWTYRGGNRNSRCQKSWSMLPLLSSDCISCENKTYLNSPNIVNISNFTIDMIKPAFNRKSGQIGSLRPLQKSTTSGSVTRLEANRNRLPNRSFRFWYTSTLLLLI